MKPENMKLLDLQTGKYLELDNDWLYGGECIYVIPTHCFCFIKSDHIIKLYYDDKVEEIQCEIPDEYKTKNGVATVYIDGKFTKYVINGKEFKCGELLRYNSTCPIKDAKICNKSEPQGILKTLYDLTGAVVYGDRYVLNPNYATIRAVILNGGEHGFIYRLESLHQCKITNKCISLDEYLKYRPELVYAEKGYTEWYIYGNPFEEYSKQLRNEPNKFQELMEKLK